MTCNETMLAQEILDGQHLDTSEEITEDHIADLADNEFAHLELDTATIDFVTSECNRLLGR